MQSIGIDIIEISRVGQAIARWGENFLRRVYTRRELELYRRRLPSLAVRFAAKEAVIKALGKPASVSLREIEILSDPTGKPVVNLYGRTKNQAQALGLKSFAISLSHSRDYAIALVSGESK